MQNKRRKGAAICRHPIFLSNFFLSLLCKAGINLPESRAGIGRVGLLDPIVVSGEIGLFLSLSALYSRSRNLKWAEVINTLSRSCRVRAT